MGTINEYQQQQIDSSAVGTPGLDNSGEIVAKGVEVSADALATRQMALDKIQAANVFYQWKSQNELSRVQTQKQYVENPLGGFKLPDGSTAPPYMAAIAKTSQDLASKILENVPPEQRPYAQELIARQNATDVPREQVWAYQQQDNAARSAMAKGDANLMIEAQSWGSADAYSEGIDNFEAHFNEASTPGGVSPRSLFLKPDEQLNKSKVSATRMYLANMSDNNNGGAIQLRNDFETNSNFRERVGEILGPKGLEEAEAKARVQVKSYMSEQTFDMYKNLGSGNEVSGKIKQMFSQPAGISVANAERDVIIAQNSLDALRRDPNAKDMEGQIGALEQHLKQSQILAEIASKRDDHDVVPTPGAYEDLFAEARNITLGISSPTELAKLNKKVGTENANVSVAGAQKPSATGAILPDVISLLTRSNDAVTANNTQSQHIQDFYAFRGRVIEARNEGRINNKQTYTLLGKIQEPLSELNEYDRIKSGDSPFAIAFNSFDQAAQKMAINVPEGTTPTEMRMLRDKIKTTLMTSFADRMDANAEVAKGLGAAQYTPGKQGAMNLVSQILDEFNAGRGVPGMKIGDPITINGKTTTFQGYNKSTGQAAVKTPQGTDDSLNNYQ